MTLLFKNTFFGGKDTKNNDTSKGIARKNNEMQIPTYFYEGAFFERQNVFYPSPKCRILLYNSHFFH